MAKSRLSLEPALGTRSAGALPRESKPLKVIHALGWYFPDSIGGTEIYVAAVARRLRQHGVETIIAAPRAGARTTEEYTHDGVPVFRYSIPAHATRAEARGDVVVRGAEAFHRWLEQQRADAVHFHTFVTGLELAEIRAARQVGSRVFVTTHSSALGYLCLRGTLMRWGQEFCDGIVQPRTCAACALDARGVPRVVAKAAAALPGAAARALNRIDQSMATALGMSAFVEERSARQREMWSTVDRFFVLTERARTMLLANGAPLPRVAVNRLGVDSSVLPLHAAPTRPHRTTPIVGFLGRLDPVKGVDVLLDAIERLPASLGLRFDLRGISDQQASNPILARVRGLAARDSRVTFSGAVARADVPSVLDSWDVLCCPGKSLEGGPTVALEAVAMGVPVIASNVGGIAELLEDGVNSAFVAPGDAGALADVLRKVAEQPDILDAWRSALPPVRSMDDVADDYLKEYAA